MARLTKSKPFAVYGYDGASENKKLVAGTHYQIDYGNASTTFITSQSGHTVTLVYSYGGSITLTEVKTTQEIYDYTHAQEELVFTTFDGTTYNSYLDLRLGTTWAAGGLEEATTKSLKFK